MAGIESLGDGAEAGVGGPTRSRRPGSSDLPKMRARAAQLAGTLDEVESKLEQRVRWISSTPAITPVKGIFTSGFGARSDPLTHGNGNHQGVDIAAGAGQPVHASADGIVMIAGEQGGLGKAVFLAHGYGVTTRYGHMSAIDVHAGQRVKRGRHRRAASATPGVRPATTSTTRCAWTASRSTPSATSSTTAPAPL